MEIKPCPWCGMTPQLNTTTTRQNYDSIGNRWDDVRTLPHEIVECNNVTCLVRPKLHRTNVSDTINIWNSYSLTSVEGDSPKATAP